MNSCKSILINISFMWLIFLNSSIFYDKENYNLSIYHLFDLLFYQIIINMFFSLCFLCGFLYSCVSKNYYNYDLYFKIVRLLFNIFSLPCFGWYIFLVVNFDKLKIKTTDLLAVFIIFELIFIVINLVFSLFDIYYHFKYKDISEQLEEGLLSIN